LYKGVGDASWPYAQRSMSDLSKFSETTINGFRQRIDLYFKPSMESGCSSIRGGAVSRNGMKQGGALY
jgi:hypothetical protein